MKIRTGHVVAAVVALAAVAAVVVVVKKTPAPAPAAPAPVAAAPLVPVPAGSKPSTVDKVAGYLGLGINLFGQGRTAGLW